MVERACSAYVTVRAADEQPWAEWTENAFKKSVRDGIRAALSAASLSEGWAKPLADWHEDIGPVLCWRFPITEPPYVGTPLDQGWPGYHTHWTAIPLPQAARD